MSKKANPTLIGSFVFGAIIIIFLGIVYLGSVKFSKDTQKFVLFFDESLNGLEIGAPVKYRGVPIGSVENILLRLPSQRPEYPYTPVIVEVDNDVLKNLGINKERELDDEDQLNQDIAEGLRAQLQLQSLITGLFYIELDKRKNAKPPIVVQYPDKLIYKEIPTIPSPLAAIGQSVDQVFAKIGSMRLDTLIDDVHKVINRLDQNIASLRADEISKNVNQTLKTLQARIADRKIDESIEKLNTVLTALEKRITDKNIDKSISKLNKSLENIDNLIIHADKKLDPFFNDLRQTVSSLEKTLHSARSSLEQIKKTGKNAEELLAADSGLRLQVETALANFSSAVKTVERLADLIERNPRSILTGKAKEDN